MITAEMQAPPTASRRPYGPDHDVHAGDEGELLQVAGDPFGPQRGREDLVDRGEHPEAARPVQVQEVAVGHQPVQHGLGEGRA